MSEHFAALCIWWLRNIVPALMNCSSWMYGNPIWILSNFILEFQFRLAAFVPQIHQGKCIKSNDSIRLLERTYSNSSLKICFSNLFSNHTDRETDSQKKMPKLNNQRKNQQNRQMLLMMIMMLTVMMPMMMLMIHGFIFLLSWRERFLFALVCTRFDFQCHTEMHMQYGTRLMCLSLE